MSQDMLAATAYEVLQHHWNGQLPVDPIKIATRMGLAVYGRGTPEDTAYPCSGNLRTTEKEVELAYDVRELLVRQRLVVAQLLGHFVLKHPTPMRLLGDFFSSADPQLQAATQFARSLLIPEPLLRQQLEKATSVAQLAETFGVSCDAMGYRLTALGFG